MLLEKTGSDHPENGGAAGAPALSVAESRYRMTGVASALLLAAGLICYALLLWSMDRYALGVAIEAYLGIRNVATNAVVTLPAALALWALTRRPWFSLLLLILLQSGIYLASAKKMAILGSPFALQDFHFITSVSLANVKLLGAYVEKPLLVLLGLLGALLFLAFVFRAERPGLGRNSYTRYGLAIAGFGLMASLHAATWPWGVIHTKQVVRPSALSLTPGVLHAGLLSSLVYKHVEAKTKTFEEDGEALRRLLADTERPEHGANNPVVAADAVAAPKPDIVVILSESFMDPRILRGMETLPEIIPTVRSLIEQGAGGWMIVPAYGSGTVRTEFEVMTGMPVAAFPNVMYPYVDITRKKIPGIVSVLEQQGYSTLAVHGNSGAFWNRTNTYLSMGIDRFITAKGFPPGGRGRDGIWYSDEAMMDIVVRELEKSSKPTFVFAASMENHGPYNKNPAVKDEHGRLGVQLPEGLDEESALMLRNYLYHLNHADAQLARLVERLRRRGRPFVVAMFGDHLPALGDVYGSLGFVNGAPGRSQYVPWIIVTGDGRRSPASANGPIRSWQFPAEVLDAADVEGDAYFDLVRDAGRKLSAQEGSGDSKALASGIRAAARARLESRFDRYVK
jgi:phosphoglycerol transferase MdoB-like AlkP superfamily enzyme